MSEISSVSQSSDTAQVRVRPWTMQESSGLSAATKLVLLQRAKPGTWYDGWRPYCVIDHCKSDLERMEPHDYGFRCRCCGNMIARDLTRLVESPLNAGKEKPYYQCLHSLRCRGCNQYWPDRCVCLRGASQPNQPDQPNEQSRERGAGR